jgi:uncharacterized membrane protein YfcA
MTPVISTLIQWVILPSIMFALFVMAWMIASTAKNAELKVSSWAGFWAGLVTFVIYVVSQLRHIQEPNFDYSKLPGFLILPLGAGLGAGFVFLWLVRQLVPTRLVGLIALMLAASSTSAVFTYIFLDTLRVQVLYCTLGTALGILLHIVLFPSSVEHLVKSAAKPAQLPADVRRGQVAELFSPSAQRSSDAQPVI